MGKWIKSSDVRGYVYLGFGILGGVATIFGFVTDEQIVTALGVVTLVSNSLAKVNVTSSQDEPAVEE